MGVRLSRNKRRNWTLTLIYRASKLLPITKASKFKLFLNLEWIFERLSHEASFKHYSTESHPVRKYTIDFITEKLKAEDSVLDLGCNAGHLTFEIAKKAKMVVGIDFDKGAIETAKAKNKLENLTFINAEAESFLKRSNQTFDVLILSHIIEHIDNPEQFLMNFRNYFKYIYIEVPDFDKSYMNHYRKDLECDLIYTDTDHVSEFDRVEIKNMLEQCGFGILESEYRFGVQRYWCKRKDV